MKAPSILLLLFSCALSSAQVRLSVLEPGSRKPLGEGSYSQQILPGGAKQVVLVIDLPSSANPTVRVRSEAVYDPEGAAIRKITEITRKGKRIERHVATFDDAGARLMSETKDGAKTRVLPLDKRSPRKATNEFWFIRDTPKPGAKVVAYNFDMNELAWKLTEVRFEGPVKLLIGGRSIKAFAIASDGYKSWVDEKGDLVRLETDRFLVERKR